MKDWLKISLLLCSFGFLKDLRFAEPFIFKFETDKRWRNVTEEQVIQEVYPIGTYTTLADLVIVFLVTDLFRYKPLIVLTGIFYVVCWVLLIWTRSIFNLQLVEIFYGAANASEVAYYSYIYAKVDKKYYHLVTSHSRAANLAGSAISGILAQILISYNLCGLMGLNYFTLGAMIIATIFAIFLPSAEKSIYFHEPTQTDLSLLEKAKKAFLKMKQHFLISFSNLYVLKWSLWWTLSSAAWYLVQTYNQTLWEAILTDKNSPDYNSSNYNGTTEAVLTVAGFLATLLAGYTKLNWKIKGDLPLATCALLQGFILIYTSEINRIFVSYVCYVTYGVLFYFTISVASSEIAKYIAEDSYGLVFGINMFVSLIISSIMSVLFVSNGIGYALPPKQQYYIYGIFNIVLSVIFIVIGFTLWGLSKNNQKNVM